MSDKAILDVLLWLGGGVLFFAELMMSFGALDHNAIANKITYSQLELEIPILGFVCIPIVSGYYTMRLDNYLKKLGIKLEKIDSEIIIPLLTTTFFITLSYVAIKNILPN
jgi:fructose-specific phosphotransferase system IIC component